jgi:SAM-dependent methyltransferase
MKTGAIFDRLVNFHLNYGRSYIVEWCTAYFQDHETGPLKILDIGCGSCTDLKNLRSLAPSRTSLFGIEVDEQNIRNCGDAGVILFPIDIEREEIPLADDTLDIVIINKIDSAKKKDIQQVIDNVKTTNPEAKIIPAKSVVTVDKPSLIRNKSVLVVEDGHRRHVDAGERDGAAAVERLERGANASSWWHTQASRRRSPGARVCPEYNPPHVRAAIQDTEGRGRSVVLLGTFSFLILLASALHFTAAEALFIRAYQALQPKLDARPSIARAKKEVII